MATQAQRQHSRWRRPALTIGAGAILGVLLLHPATMAIYWLEFRQQLVGDSNHLWHFIGNRMALSFTPPMLPMTGLFAALGGLMGSLSAALDARLRRSEEAISRLERLVARDVPTLIRRGESEHVEFKSSVRWDLRTEKVNKALSQVVAKTIVALANHQGGSLLIGVDDDGDILGLERDYQTLKSRDRDGFAQFLMTLVRERMGGHVCRLVHVLFSEIDGQDVCRVAVEAADQPVYLQDGGQSRFFVRTGNASRELDAREIVEYVAARWNGGR
ncbi:MAG: ATP-binding protein [Deltaproteobacteria bacterium]|nr:ATP-binding protein [Deltaproteobacteria bacterium]